MANNRFGNITRSSLDLIGGIANIFKDTNVVEGAEQARLQSRMLGDRQFSKGDYDSLNGQWQGLARTNYTGRDFFAPDGKQGFFDFLDAGLQGYHYGSDLGNSIEQSLQQNQYGMGGAIGGLAGAGVFQTLKGVDYINRAVKAKQEANKINAENEYYNSLMTSRYADANQQTHDMLFNNAAMLLHADGGPLASNGIDWDNGLTHIDEGGTHEENSLGGVPQGVAPDGTPNLVEENETVYKNSNGEKYVFSYRLTADKDDLENAGLPDEYEGMPFSMISKKLSKEYDETVNDPISKRGRNAMLDRLQSAQEYHKMKMQQQQALQQQLAAQQSFNSYPTEAEFGGEQIPEEYDMQNNGMNPMVGMDAFGGQLFACGGKKYGTGGYVIDLNGSRHFVEDIDAYLATNPDSHLDYENPYDENPTVGRERKVKSTDSNWFDDRMRYAPYFQNMGALLYNIAKKPDYSLPRSMQAIAAQLPMQNYHPVANQYFYKTLPINSTLNAIDSQNVATQRMIADSYAGNRAAAIPALISGNARALQARGDALNQWYSADLNARNAVAQGRAGIAAQNAANATNVDAANSSILGNKANIFNTAAATIENIGNLRGQAISAASEAVANTEHAIGNENLNFNMVNRSGLPYGYDFDRLAYYTGKRAACGGHIKNVSGSIKSKRRTK